MRNYLKGTVGDSINLMLAAAAFNFKKWTKEVQLFLLAIIINVLFNNEPLRQLA